ncbi:MAG: glycosyltransferase family 2 protein, partial [Nanoarchaeota archaeon]|nr:glycosyltransferase family 2 protein [Nanoarchaeota archaeon]
QGAALRTGIEYAVKQHAKVIVTFDADGQHRVEDIKKIIRPVIMGQVDVTLGSRFLSKGSNTPPLKALALKAGAVFNWMMYGVRLTDAHNGFRALSLKAAKLIDITADKMEHASEILDEIRKKDLSYMEVPVKIRYTDYSMGKGQGWIRFIPLGFRIIIRKIMKIL